MHVYHSILQVKKKTFLAGNQTVYVRLPPKPQCNWVLAVILKITWIVFETITFFLVLRVCLCQGLTLLFVKLCSFECDATICSQTNDHRSLAKCILWDAPYATCYFNTSTGHVLLLLLLFLCPNISPHNTTQMHTSNQFRCINCINALCDMLYEYYQQF